MKDYSLAIRWGKKMAILGLTAMVKLLALLLQLLLLAKLIKSLLEDVIHLLRSEIK